MRERRLIVPPNILSAQEAATRAVLCLLLRGRGELWPQPLAAGADTQPRAF